jgi:hypothetical protein
MRLKDQQQQMGVSRREFLGFVAAANGALLVEQSRIWAAEPDPRIKEIVAKTITVDLHNHWSASGGAANQGEGIIAAMKQGGDSLVCLTYAVDGSLMGGGDPEPGTRSNLRRDPKPGEMYDAHLKSEDGYDALLDRRNSCNAF